MCMSAELMKSKVVRPSVVRPSVCGIDYLWSYCMAFFQILVVAPLGPYAQKFFFSKTIFFLDFFTKYFSFPLTWGPYGRQNFAMLLFPKITFESFQTFSEFSSQWSWQKYCFGYLKFELLIFQEFFFAFVNMGPMSTNLDHLLDDSNCQENWKHYRNVPSYQLWSALNDPNIIFTTPSSLRCPYI